jgi:hypothetical protein
MDVLTDVLDALELKGSISARKALVPPWRYTFAASRDMVFHLLGCGMHAQTGGGHLVLEGDPPYRARRASVARAR